MSSQPTPSDVHVNSVLTRMMIDWNLTNPVYAFNRVFPMLGVDKKSGTFFIRNREDSQRDAAVVRGPGSHVPRGVRRVSKDIYQCDRFAYGEAIDDETAANADDPLNLEQSAMRAVGDKLMLKLERQFVAKAIALGVWKGSTTGTDLVGGVDFAKIAAPATGNPITEALRPQITHLGKLGIRPSEMKLVMSSDVMATFLDQDEFLNRLSDSDVKVLSEERLKTILGIGEVVVPTLGFNPNAETEPGGNGAPNANEYVMQDSMLLLYTPSAPSITLPSAGYSFTWSGLNGSQNGMRVKRYRDEPIESTIIEGEATIDPKVTSPELGIFFSQVLA